MTAAVDSGRQQAGEGAASTSAKAGGRQPFLEFDPADLASVRVRPADFARMMSVSRTAVSKWIKDGKVSLGADGRLDPHAAAQQVMRNTDPARARARALKGALGDTGELRRQVRELQRQLDAERAARAHTMHADDVEARLGKMLDAVGAGLPALAEARRQGSVSLALDWLAAVAFRGWSGDDLAEAFGADDAVMRALFGVGGVAGPSEGGRHLRGQGGANAR